MIATLKNNRLNKKFDESSKKNEHALICYVVAGYPDVTTTEDIISSRALSGADIIEIGIPFSDPIRRFSYTRGITSGVVESASHLRNV